MHAASQRLPLQPSHTPRSLPQQSPDLLLSCTMPVTTSISEFPSPEMVVGTSFIHFHSVRAPSAPVFVPNSCGARPAARPSSRSTSNPIGNRLAFSAPNQVRTGILYVLSRDRDCLFPNFSLPCLARCTFSQISGARVVYRGGLVAGLCLSAMRADFS